MVLRVFCSFAHEDERFRERLFAHAAAMRREGLIDLWYDGRIVPGQDWNEEIRTALASIEVVLLLVSADFLASDFCWGVEMKTALQRSERHEAVALPIICRPCDWRATPLARLEALPSGARPISRWESEDEAYLDVVQGLRHLAGVIRGPVRPTAVAIAEEDADAPPSIWGRVIDQKAGTPVVGVCVTLGPPIQCFTESDARGVFAIDLGRVGAAAGSEWDLWFIRSGYVTTYSGTFAVKGSVTIRVDLAPSED